MPWTLAHVKTLIPCMIVYMLIAILIAKLLKNKPDKIKLIPIYVITGIIIVLEIIKQCRSIDLGYDLSDLPLYYCSLFLYFYPATCLYHGKHKDVVRLLTLLTGMALLGVMIIMPNVVYSDGAINNYFKDFDDFHTVFYHNIILLGTLILLMIDVINVNPKRDIKVVFIGYCLYCIVVVPIALLTKTNFNQFYRSYVPFVEDLRLFLIDKMAFGGQIVYDICAMFWTVGFSVLMFYVLTFILKKIHKKNT